MTDYMAPRSQQDLLSGPLREVCHLALHTQTKGSLWEPLLSSTVTLSKAQTL